MANRENKISVILYEDTIDALIALPDESMSKVMKSILCRDRNPLSWTRWNRSFFGCSTDKWRGRAICQMNGPRRGLPKVRKQPKHKQRIPAIKMYQTMSKQKQLISKSKQTLSKQKQNPTPQPLPQP